MPSSRRRAASRPHLVLVERLARPSRRRPCAPTPRSGGGAPRAAAACARRGRTCAGSRSRRSSSTSRKCRVVRSAVSAPRRCEHGVRRDRRAVHDLGDAARSRRLGQAGDGLDDRPVVGRRRREQLVHADAPVGLVEDHVGERPADVDPDPRAAHLRFAIANCIAGEHRANCPAHGSPRDADLAARGARVGRAARRAHAPRPDRRREAARGDAARAARPRAAARRLADARARRPEPARARGVRRRHPDRPRGREPADARGLRGDLRGAARSRGPRGEARRPRGRARRRSRA